jgi:hypothetical protein
MLKIREKKGLWSPVHKEYEVPLIDGGTIWDYIPDFYKRIEVVSVTLNGKPIYNEELRSVQPKSGDVLNLAPYAGIFQLVLSIFLYAASWAIGNWLTQDAEQSRRRATLGNAYAVNLMQNNRAEGAPIGVLDGEHRIPGQIIQVSTTKQTEGRDHINMLIGLSEGPIDAINPNGVGVDLHIDGNPASNYRGTVISRLGTLNDVPITGFQFVTNTLAVSNQLSKGSSVILIGTATADRFVIKLTMVSGMYEIDGDGHYHSVILHCEYRYRTTAGPGAWSSWFPATAPFDANGYFSRRNASPFSIWFGADFPTNDQYDVELRRRLGSHHDGSDDFCDSYIKEYQQITNADLIYPFLAKIALQLLGSDQLTGQPSRVTTHARGRIVMQLTSATAVSAPAFTQNPAHLALDKIYNYRYATASRWDTRLKVTLSGVSGGPYTVGEVVDGPASSYPFRGIVRAWNNSTSEMVVESLRGLPYGVLTGDASGATGTVSSIDEAYAVDLASMWAFAQFCDGWVPDGSTVTNVNTDSPAAGNIVYVISTAPFAVDDQIVIDYEGPKEEDQKVQAILAGPPRLQIYGTLANTHLAVEAAEVSVAERRCEFDYYWDGRENGRTMLERYARVSQAALIFEPKIRFVPLKLETPTGIICKGNTGVNSFKISYGSGVKDKLNRLDVKFRDRVYDYNFNVARTDAPELIASTDEEILDQEQEFFGITRGSQAGRQGWFRLKRIRYTGKQIQILLGPDHLDIQVMDVKWLQNDVPGIGFDGGRVMEGSTASTVRLDTPITLPAGTYYLRIQRKDGTQQSEQITNSPGTHRYITVAAPFSPAPVEWDLWGAGELGRFRCVSLKPNQDGDAETVWEEDAEEYYTDKFGVLPTFTPSTLPDPDELPPDVEDLRLQEGVARLPGGQLQHFIDVSFRRPDHNNWAKAQIYVKELCARWQSQGKSNFTWGTGGTEFQQPMGVWTGDVGGSPITFVADMRNFRVLKLDGNDFSNIGQVGTTGTAGDTSALLRFPTDVCCDGTYLFILDGSNGKIKVYNAATLAWVSTFGSIGTGNGQFVFPQGICTDGTNVWVADTANHRIQKLLNTAGTLSYVSQIGSIGSGNDNFNNPYGIDVGPTNIYVADMGNHRFHKRDKGTLAYVAQAGTGPSSDPDKFNRPVDITVDSTESSVWVCDLRNHRISTWDASAMTHNDNVGSYGVGRDQFKAPHGIQHYDGGIYIVEAFTHRLTVRDEGEAVPDFWDFVGETTENEYRITGNLQPGESYRVSVPSVSPANVKKNPGDAPQEDMAISAVGGAPPNVANLYATNEGSSVRLYWDGVISPDLAGYEIRAGGDWLAGVRIGQVGKDVVEYTLSQSRVANGGFTEYWIKAFTTSNQFSPTATYRQFAHPRIAPLANVLPQAGAVNQRP